MNELKAALGLGGAVVSRAVPAPPEVDGFWQSADPAGAGPRRRGDRGAPGGTAKVSGADAVLVAYRGKVISEWYSPRYRTPAYTMSSVKSITGLLAGLLVADGKLAVDDPVSRFVPGWAEGRRARVTAARLLTMSSGLSRIPACRPRASGSPPTRAGSSSAWSPRTSRARMGLQQQGGASSSRRSSRRPPACPCRTTPATACSGRSAWTRLG